MTNNMGYAQARALVKQEPVLRPCPSNAARSKHCVESDILAGFTPIHKSWKLAKMFIENVIHIEE